jgi:hypothetical protein
MNCDDEAEARRRGGEGRTKGRYGRRSMTVEKRAPEMITNTTFARRSSRTSCSVSSEM